MPKLQFSVLSSILLCLSLFFVPGDAQADAAPVKSGDIIIYHDPGFYAAFPSIVQRPDGELICAFRRAPDRRVFGEKGNNHVDPNSYLVLVRSHDNGKTWTKDPELIFAHPYGGSQDPCLLQLDDGTLICTSYGWARVDDSVKESYSETLRHGNFVFMGGYLVRSADGGHSWSDAILPPPVPASADTSAFKRPVAAYNRGAPIQGSDGRIYWAVAAQATVQPRRTETHLMISEDGGLNWEYSCPIASDEKITFNETSLYESPGGKLIAFMRTAHADDHTIVARSEDGGKSFLPFEDTGWKGHPHFALPLPDGRVFLIYGYRHDPWGIRARVLNAECTDVAEAEEIVLRDDGQGGDLGYPWATLTADGRILVVYYFHDQGKISHIAGTFLDLPGSVEQQIRIEN
ncbi:MAG: exo-alpha-sialidase [Candidatus Hydrogenedens sp.]|jgi:hypothetical protein|nr:exo-alpha-sialidase [Candidatus Hydrogenedens sp.]